MIRIIENGQYCSVTCSCGCKYSFDKNDIDENKKVKCPECDKLNEVKTK